MNQVLTILWAKMRIGRHQVASVRHESKLKIAVITVAALGLWVGAFILFREGFEFLLRAVVGDNSYTEFNLADILMSRMLSVFALAIFLMLIFSNVLVSFSTLYRAKEVAYLLQAPLSFRQFFYARFFEAATFSSWALAYLGSPLMLAYGLSTDANWLFYVAILLFYVPFIMIPAAIASIITMILARIFPILKVRTMVLLALLAVAAFGYYIYTILEGANFDPSSEIDGRQFFTNLIQNTARIQSPFLPSSWLSLGLIAAAKLQWEPFAFNWLLMLANAGLILVVAGELAQVLFYPGWSTITGQDRQRIKPIDRGALALLERLLQPIRNPERALLIKDIKLFWRDPTQWSQTFVFFGMLGIYFATLRTTAPNRDQEFWRSAIANLNVGSVMLILATLTSRFIFPLISLEGRRFWILGLAPLSLRQLVLQKFGLSLLTNTAITVALACLSGYMLKLAPLNFGLTIYSVFLANLGLSGLAVGLGSLYPTFTEDNPARIVSGLGGTLNLLMSVGYITLMVASQAVILQWQVLEAFTSPEAFAKALAIVVLFITLLTCACTVVPVYLGLRNLKRLEF